jgi:2-polyprenyl-3-methyl-5-hydroxy-6-metoxy-1,4-benzoquinol methylase
MNVAAAGIRSAGDAFDCIAEQYDDLFTRSLIGRAQREVVWALLHKTFAKGMKILELNCGTGEDAIHMAELGMNVTACDASPRMVEVARRKRAAVGDHSQVAFQVIPTERLLEIAYRGPFDGIFSNFAGLNCVSDMHDVADQLASLTQPGAWMLLCVCTRFCAWELLYYGLRGDWSKASRRWRGKTQAAVCGVEVGVQYPTVREMKAVFAPWFCLRSITAVGLAVPPSYMEAWSQNHKTTFGFLQRLDRMTRQVPVLRACGDHVLLAYQRCTT